jgi:hypothetical protein
MVILAVRFAAAKACQEKPATGIVRAGSWCGTMLFLLAYLNVRHKNRLQLPSINREMLLF